MYVRTRGFGQVAEQPEKTLVAVPSGQEKMLLAVPEVDAVSPPVVVDVSGSTSEAVKTVVITPPTELPPVFQPSPVASQADPCAMMRAQMPTCFPAGAAPCPECPPCPLSTPCPECPECATCAECPACAECPVCAAGGGVEKAEAAGGFSWWWILAAAGAGVAVGVAAGRAMR